MYFIVKISSFKILPPKKKKKNLISMCSPIARNHSHTAVHQFRCVGENKHAVIPSWVFDFKTK